MLSRFAFTTLFISLPLTSWATEDLLVRRVQFKEGEIGPIFSHLGSPPSLISIDSGTFKFLVRTWDIADFKPIDSWEIPSETRSPRASQIAATNSLDRVFFSASDCAVHLLDMQGRKELRTFGHFSDDGKCGYQQLVSSLALSEDERFLVTGSEDGTVRMFAIDTGALMQDLKTNSRQIRTVGFLDHNRIYAHDHYEMTVWDLASGAILKRYPAEGPVTHVEFSPDKQLFVTCTHDKQVQIWDTSSGNMVQFYQLPYDVYSAGFTPDGRHLLVASQAALYFLNTATWEQDYKLPGPLWGFDFSPKGDFILGYFFDYLMLYRFPKI